MFKNQIGTTIEVYVDDMLVKTRNMMGHMGDLKTTFEILRKTR